jgi:hypothetical protein
VAKDAPKKASHSVPFMRNGSAQAIDGSALLAHAMPMSEQLRSRAWVLATTIIASRTVAVRAASPRASPSSIRRSMVTESSGEVSGAHGDASARGYQVAAPRETPA